MRPGALRRLGCALAVGVAAALLGACEDNIPYQEHFVPGGDPERGLLAMEKYGCGFCHYIPGVEGIQEIVAPPLTAWADRQYIAGELPNRAENLILWIMDPHAVEPGTAMPNLGVSEAEARDIAAYLYTLDANVPVGPLDTLRTEEVR